ncbi:MAG: hypothetical protein QXH20_01250, partial [Candidatus Bathyarchaeia archaeon]
RSMMLLEIVTPERLLLSEEVEEVILPGELGQLGILPGHHPLLEKRQLTSQMKVNDTQFLLSRKSHKITIPTSPLVNYDCTTKKQKAKNYPTD